MLTDKKDHPSSLIKENSSEASLSFELMGAHMRVLVGPGKDNNQQAALRVKAFLENYNQQLSRFRVDSELSRLNEDPRETVNISPLLSEALEAALWSWRKSKGLVDPTLLEKLEELGYKNHWQKERQLPVDQIVNTDFHKARANPQSRCGEIVITETTVTRPAGLRIDNGGSGKGHAADKASEILADFDYWAVDCGGDIRIGGKVPRLVEIIGPVAPIADILVQNGAIATSGISSRAWISDHGPTHHLINPFTGKSAWTGVIQASAIGTSAIEAETLAKMAFLSGPEEGAHILEEKGGVLVLSTGQVKKINLPAPRIVFKRGA